MVRHGWTLLAIWFSRSCLGTVWGGAELGQAIAVFRAMPLIQITPAEKAAGLSNMEPDLGYLLHDRGVSEDLVAIFGHHKIVKMNVFARIESTEENIRAWLDNDLGLKRSEGVEQKVLIACVVDAWEAARERVKRQADAESLARVEGRPKELLKGTHLSLRRAFFATFEETEEKFMPSRQMMDMRFDQIEEGEVKAEPLCEVVSLSKEELSEGTGNEVDVSLAGSKNGSIRLKTNKVRTSPPESPEQLRTFYRIIANHWQMVKLRLPGKGFLKNHSRTDWDDMVTHILGEEVWGLEAKSAGGQVIAKPSWLQVLEYEFQVRKAAYKSINEGAELSDALKAAKASDSIKTRYLITPMAVAATAAKNETRIAIWQPEQARDEAGLAAWANKGKWQPKHNDNSKGGGKANKKGKGGKSGKGGDKGSGGGGGGKGGGKEGVQNFFNQAKKNPALAPKLKFTTADGRKICFRYNKGHCAADACAFAHVCAKCEGSHPYQSCPTWDR